MEKAALSLAVAAVSPIITKLSNSAASYFGGDITREELRGLQTSILPKIRTVIEAAEKIDAATLKPWLMELKAAAYEAEDMLDLYEYKKIRNEVSPLPASLKNIKGKAKELFAPALLKTSLKKSLEKLQHSANEADKLISLLQLVTIINSSTAQQQDNNTLRRQQHTTVSAPSAPVFGRDEERNSLINMLITEPHDQSSSKKNNVHVHAIHGLGGAGKTTLAQYIYKDERVENHFDSKIWVHVSRIFEVYRITKEIIESVLIKKCESSPDSSLDFLQKKLMEALKSKRFLLVLDDVWHIERDQWDQLLIPLNEVGEVGSRILITTRTERVALTLGVKSRVFLKELKTEDCWSIVKHYAFGEDKADPEFEDVGKQIAKKLKNSPLAARVVGSSLAQKVSIDEWKMFLKDDNILKDTIGALYLSFQQLSPTLQRCFAYCSLHPKGFAFWDVDDLVRMWIAQGFIEAPSTNDLAWEEKGRQCFNDLLSNSFFQIERNRHGRWYVIHDLLHDLAEEVSKGDCFRIEDEEEPVTIPDTIIHLSIATRKLVVPMHDILKLVNLRSFIIHFSADDKNTIVGTKEMFENFKRLRVLRFGWEPMSELNSCIGQLNHLRYFQVRGVEKLPKSFSRLYHLQFLRLQDNNIDRVPKGMSNLVNYRGILGGYGSEMTKFHSVIPMVGKLTSLQTLKEYHIKKNSWQHGIEQLKSLQELRGSLTIKGLENVKDKAQATLALLNKKEYLEKLRLEWDSSSSSSSRTGDGEDEDVIEGLDPHPNLKGLEISGYEGAKLPSWYMLNHQDLQTLELMDCPNLTAIGLPPNLKELRVYQCPKLMQLSPFSRSLEEVNIEDCPGFEALLSSNDGGDENNSLQPFSLESLRIVNCSLLDEKTHGASLEKFNSLSELYLERLPSVTSLLLGGPNLTALTITDLPELTSIGNLQLLTSLESLTVYKCPKLTPTGVDDRLPSFIKADHLRIDDPLLLPVLLHEQRLNSLEELEIRECSQDIPFTAEQEDIFLRLTSLKYLEFHDSKNLQSLPVNLEKLSSLEELIIYGCPEIKSLPNLPVSLQSLLTIRCTQLVVKYGEGGPLRHKIHYIPDIFIF